MSDKKPIVYVKAFSTSIERCLYKQEEEQLYVEFKNGSVYRYEEVTFKEFTNFLKSESQGSFLAKKIKNVKDYVKVKKFPKF